MNRIYIIGISGSGKTYLASRLSKILKIKTYDLDEIVLKKNSFQKVSEKIRDSRVKSIIKRKKWIIEGAYSKDWVIPIYKKASFVIILNSHPLIIKKRILMRTLKRKLGFIKYHRKESFRDFIELLVYIDNYHKKSLPIHKSMVKEHKKQCKILKNRSEVNKFLEEIKP